MSEDIIVLARRHKHIASHYDGCEADHVGCLVNKLADEVEGLRAQLEERYIAMRVRQLQHALDAERQTVRRLRAALYRIAGKVPFADDPWTIARNALKGKP